MAVRKDSPGEKRVVLAVDVGNTETSLGLFVDGALAATWTLTTPARLTEDEAFDAVLSSLERMERRAEYRLWERAVSPEPGGGELPFPSLPEPSDSVLSCVVPDLAAPWQAALQLLTARRPLVVGPGIKTGIRMRYRDPGEIGADRMADLAALCVDHELPAIVVDMGTTTNFEVVDGEGVFLGGVIAPGMALGARSLAREAAKLPSIEVAAPKRVVGTCTREAIQSGVVLGEIARIDGLIDLIERETGLSFSVIVTGTDAAAVAPLLRHEAQPDETLTLRGLARLHALNRR